MSKPTLPVIIIFLIFFQGVLLAQTPSTRFWVPNLNVMTMKRNGNIMYLGGDFTRIGPRCSYGGVLDNACMPDTNYALPNNAVNCVIPDGAGGWFIAGDFTKVGDSTRNTLAHLNVSGHVTAWNPQITGFARSLLLSGDTLFIGGIFTAIGGQSRQNLAAVNANTGAVFNWNPGCNGDIQAFRIIGTKLYIGGDFTTIGGQTRGRLASFDRTTGSITTWNPNANNYVTCFSNSHDTLFVGGSFTFIGGQSRTGLAAFNTSLATNTTTAWNVSITGPPSGLSISDLAISGKRLFICGTFETVSGQTRKCLAAVDVTLNTGNLLSWYPANMSGGSIDCLAIKGNSLIFGGYFGEPGVRIASVNINTAALDSWTPDADSYISSLAVNGSSVYVGGGFSAIGGVKRSKAAAINLLNGELTCWNPDIDFYGDIRAIAFSNDTVYLGGFFFSVGGVSRKSLAAVNNSTGEILPWKTDMGGSGAGGNIADMVVHGNELIVAGGFVTTGYVVNRLASFYRNLNTNNTKLWNPGFSASGSEYLNSILLKGDTLYAAGKFTQVDGQPRNNLAAFNVSSNSLLPWDPNSNAMVYELQSSGETIYACGGFGSVGGQVRKGIVAIEAGSGNVTPWYPNPSNGLASTNVGGIGVWDNVLYCYGAFNTIGGQPRTRYAALDLGSSAAALPWFPPFITPGGGCFYVDSSILMLGGNFTSSNTYKAHAFMEAFTPVGTTSFDPIIASSAVGSVCPGTAVTLTVNEDFAGNPANLYWYSGSCGGTLVGTGSTIMVQPGTTTTYFLRTQGACSSYGGCNSITVNVHPNQQMTVTPDTDLCLGDSVMLTASGAVSYNWGALGLGPAQTVAPITNTTYTVIGTDTHGCKDTADIHVQIHPIWSFTENHSMCEGEVYTWHGTNYSTPGTYTVNYLSVNGCDSSYTLYLTVNPVYAFTENHSMCEGESYLWHGTNYTLAGTYTANYLSVNGCDSSYTLYLNVNPIFAVTENHSMCEGESYTWHGTNYTLAGTYTDIHASINGCDSSYILHLNVNPIFAVTENHNMCEGESYLWHGTNYTLAGTYTANYLSANGCDSSYTLYLTVNPVYAFTENHTVCENEIYSWQGTDYSTPGTYTANYSTVNGCDSSYILHLTVNPIFAATENHNMCEGESYTWHGTNYTLAGTYTDIHASINGCDSSYILYLTVNPVYAFTENHTVCENEIYSWQGTDYSTPGTYTANYSTVNGCDSSYILHLNVNPIFAVTENHNMCEGESYLWHGTNYTLAGEYTANYLSVNGCDSSYTLYLTVNPVYAFTENHTVCENQIYSWQGTDYSTPGTYIANYSTVNGCDSSYTLNLSVNPVYAFTENHSMCEGEVYTWHGVNYSTAGTYMANYLSVIGCDSSYILNLSVTPLNLSVHVDGLTITANQSNATYQWLDCNEGLTPINGEMNQSFTADENGNYAVLITSGSCSDTSECIGIQNVGLASETISGINVYPNPFSKELLIVSDDQKQWDVQIFNAVGQNVFNGLAVGKTSISTVVFAPGLYLIQLSSNDFKYYKKLIKE